MSLPAIPAPCIGNSQGLAASFLIQLIADVPSKASEGKYFGPCIYMGAWEDAPGSWISVSSVLSLMTIWGVNKQMECLSFCNLIFKLINKSLRTNITMIWCHFLHLHNLHSWFLSFVENWWVSHLFQYFPWLFHISQNMFPIVAMPWQIQYCTAKQILTQWVGNLFIFKKVGKGIASWYLLYIQIKR